MSTKNITIVAQLERHDICLRAESYDYICYCSDCCPTSPLSEQFDMLDSRKLEKSEELINLWYSKTIDLGRKYIKGWVKRGLDTINILLYEFKSFLYIIKLTGNCNFLKRNDIYDNIRSVMNPSETSTSVLINRRRFNIIMIAWSYLNQSYFRNSKALYEDLQPFYQTETHIIRKFESYYGLKFIRIKVETS
jgi:hypothetical protein